ncbi:helix-turn-helix domain-containing protein [uncultured Dialister sp.]|uniref:helix-turn-helix domain-containing protein n=1 Tax=uncultured Dialister sp. TaxID=278064 RepID=UPI002593C659|nr:helix-turn-helix domain-containing protein [uncultured Dialister sp.]
MDNMRNEQLRSIGKIWWTPSEVREVLFSNKISKASLMKLIHNHEIPARQFGVKLYFVPNGWVERQIEDSKKVNLDD